MTARFRMAWAVALPILVSLGSGLSSVAHADSLDFEQAPVSNAVAKLDKTFGVSIVIDGASNPNTPVDVLVADLDRPGARLDAINQLANSLGLDFQKSYVISKVSDDTAIPDVRLDTTSHVVFADNTVDAAAAIQKIGLLDAAIVHFSDPVSGKVNLSDTDLQASDAADQIAKQTHTVWQAVYTLTPRSQPAVERGKIVDRTNEGQPIVQLPFSTYFSPAPKVLDTTPQQQTTSVQVPSTVVAPATGQAPAATTSQPNAMALPNQTMPYANPNGYANPYANPYGYPYGNPYASAYGNPYGNSYVNPYANSYGNSYADPNGDAYSNPYGDAYGNPYYNGPVPGPTPFGNGAIVVAPSAVNPYSNGFNVIGGVSP